MCALLNLRGSFMANQTISKSPVLVINGGEQASNRGAVNTGTSTSVSVRALAALYYAAGMNTAQKPRFSGSYAAWSAVISALGTDSFLGIPVMIDESVPHGELHACGSVYVLGKLTGITG
jgi:hypothetical protein